MNLLQWINDEVGKIDPAKAEGTNQAIRPGEEVVCTIESNWLKQLIGLRLQLAPKLEELYNKVSERRLELERDFSFSEHEKHDRSNCPDCALFREYKFFDNRCKAVNDLFWASIWETVITSGFIADRDDRDGIGFRAGWQIVSLPPKTNPLDGLAQLLYTRAQERGFVPVSDC